MRIIAPLFALALAAAPTLALAQTEPTRAEQQRIDRILRRTPLIDGHNDLPWAIRDDHGGDLAAIDLDRDTRRLTPPLHTDIPRLRRGRVGAQFWSVYVPATFKDLDATQATFEQIDLARRIIARYPRAFEFADSADDIVRIHRAGRIASMFGMEGGEAINNNLALLREFRAAGILYMTLTHAQNTDWVDSATDAPAHGGLTDFGEEVVREMNRVGMLVDLSHVSAEAMRDALRVSAAPVIFSHSSAFALTPHPRNVPDDVLRLVRENGGVVMVNFNAPFISEPMRQWSATRSGEERRLQALHPGDPDAARAALEQWTTANPPPPVTIDDLANHIEHIARIAGRDHVGIGSDYDGVSYLPQGMGGVETYPNLFAELIRRGWSDSDLAKLAGGNLLRVLRAAERVAARS
ncbi:MAG TPA: dipeptidase [Vitreimonas sp.]|uniref:dipeptidase n=1 Tax=Vitreimonas sp. TaxID=3069702 RepID=UPI002D4E7169|nr:dipeptidase [Vitreimonas sp.]HYD89332.1 dipeptidase [Vitreimonas sp.]